MFEWSKISSRRSHTREENMGVISMIIVTLVVLVAAFIVSKFYGKDALSPQMRDGWFGRGSESPKDEAIRPFRVDVSEDVLDDLKRRLDNVRLGEDLKNVQFQYGFKVSYMREVLEYWKTEYDWRKHEKQLNAFPQFVTNIEGIDVHFIHAKPAKPSKSGRVLLMSHGWPGSVWEFYKILPMLTDPASHGGRQEDAVEVICPSIPGYGFSEAPHQTGFNPVAAARIYWKLMTRLGHDKFYVQGGDWGSMISTVIAQAYPHNVLGIHVNMFTPRLMDPVTGLKQVLASYFPSLIGVTPREYEKSYPLSKAFVKLLRETGYLHLQATRPDTVAFGLNDSPVGLAAYILEKLSVWTNMEYLNKDDGGLTEKFTLDELLTNVMVYWVTGTIGSSMRFYKENFASSEVQKWDRTPVTVPAGLANFPNEIYNAPRVLVESKFQNIIQFTVMPRGGHFAAFEEPRLVADDIFAFVKKVERSK